MAFIQNNDVVASYKALDEAYKGIMTSRAHTLRLPRFVRVIFAMIMREMATTYGRSYFGYFWAILEPVGGVAILSLAFSFALRSPGLGDSFPLFYATGYLLFVTFNIMQKNINSSIRENRQLLFYPRVTYIDAVISRFVLTFVTQLLVAVVVFGGIVLLFSLNVNLDPVPVILAFAAAALLGCGIGSINAVLIYLFPAWRQVWAIITKPLFFVSSIFYLFETLPVWAQGVLWYNPLVHVIGATRDGFYPNYHADYVSLSYVAIIGAASLLWGLVLMRRYSAAMIN